MREILFRGKRVDNGEWYYGDIFHSSVDVDTVRIHDYINRANAAIVPETIGQFTGLTDENGKKIFEGDIIRRKRTDGFWYNYEVFWWDNCWGIKDGVSPCVIIPLCGIQIIGNIHDNPELLGGAK